MITQAWMELGSAFGMFFVFGKRGEGLPMHTHPPEEHHAVQCTGGKLRIEVEGHFTHTLFAGEALELPEGIEHEIVALEDLSSALNIYRRGKPAIYATLPAAERCTSYESRPLKHPLRD